LVLFSFGGRTRRELIRRNDGEVADVKGAMNPPWFRHVDDVRDIGDLLDDLERPYAPTRKFGRRSETVTRKVEMMSVEHHHGSNFESRVDGYAR